jgi:hypothetical protein
MSDCEESPVKFTTGHEFLVRYMYRRWKCVSELQLTVNSQAARFTYVVYLYVLRRTATLGYDLQSYLGVFREHTVQGR